MGDSGGGLLSSGVLSSLNDGSPSCLYWPVSFRAMGPEPRGHGRDTVSSKQRNLSHKQSCIGGCGLFCFLFKALADELCGWPLLSLGFECYLDSIQKAETMLNLAGEGGGKEREG